MPIIGQGRVGPLTRVGSGRVGPGRVGSGRVGRVQGISELRKWWHSEASEIEVYGNMAFNSVLFVYKSALSCYRFVHDGLGTNRRSLGLTRTSNNSRLLR